MPPPPPRATLGLVSLACLASSRGIVILVIVVCVLVSGTYFLEIISACVGVCCSPAAVVAVATSTHSHWVSTFARLHLHPSSAMREGESRANATADARKKDVNSNDNKVGLLHKQYGGINLGATRRGGRECGRVCFHSSRNSFAI